MERKKKLDECFEQRAIRLGEEGLVVKDLYGHYVVRCPCSSPGVGLFCSVMWSLDEPRRGADG